ncbi:MAG: nitroreductase [Candidatus Thorarchaeota archaeon]|nr:nitroreductase [Candidatus Thorarchaeota archaeon]
MGEDTEMLLEEIVKRRSGRAFTRKHVSDEMLNSILQAGRRAPSCANTQAWNFVVLKSPDALERAHEAVSRGNAWGKRAPLMIIVAAKEDAGCGSHGLPYFMMDIGLATENILLQAFHLGLMAHPTAGWDEEKLKQITGIPEEYRIGTVIFIGYEGDFDQLDERTKEKEKAGFSRKPLSDIVHWDKW